MFKYIQFDLTNKPKKTKILKVIVNIIIISFILIIVLFNIDTKADVKIISSNSRRIINTLNNYTESMSDFMVSSNEMNDINEMNEIKNIRLLINYFKELKEKEIKQEELKKEELKEKEFKERELTEQKIKEKELKDKKERAINLIKFYIPNYNSLINLGPTHLTINRYSNNFNCLQRLIKINGEELFNNLIKIDYENNEVSFNYLDKNEEYYKNTNNIIKSHLYTDYDENNKYYNYSHYIYGNYKENIIKNPIYQIIKNNLEIDSYTEPNLTDEYNNKSKYFQQSLKDFSEIAYDSLGYNEYINKYYEKYENNKYHEKYENDKYYLYYKIVNTHSDNNFVNTWFVEFIIEDNFYINNPNPIDIYNKHAYKFICNIPSRTSINNKPAVYKSTNLNKQILLEELNYDYSVFNNYIITSWGEKQTVSSYYINKNNIEEILNNQYDEHYNNYCIYPYNYNEILYISLYGSSYSPICCSHNKYVGTRMLKHNLTNNMHNYNYVYPWNELHISNKYIFRGVYIDFPLITIYDEYEYIKLILSNITADIYNLPIIPPIKFM